jgi:uncharacterized protein
MAVSGHTVRKIRRPVVSVAALFAAALSVASAHAQTPEPKSPAATRIIVIGEGKVTVTPDYAAIRSGVTTTAKTVKEASDTNAKIMTAITAALLDSGIAQKDMQTSQFSVEPIYTNPASIASKFETTAIAPKLVGFRVSNQVNVTIRQLSQVGEILDRLVKAGATDIGNLAFLVNDPAKPLDQAREAAFADARRKAELYARAAGVNLGRVMWITESSNYQALPTSVEDVRSQPAPAPPIQSGEETLQAVITVGFEIVQ